MLQRPLYSKLLFFNRADSYCKYLRTTRARVGTSVNFPKLLYSFEQPHFKYICQQEHDNISRNDINSRLIHTSHQSLILGIETSCDDTGAAIVDSKGNVIGEALNSQLQTHLE